MRGWLSALHFIIIAASEIISKFTFQLSVGSAGERERRFDCGVSSQLDLFIIVVVVALGDCAINCIALWSDLKHVNFIIIWALSNCRISTGSYWNFPYRTLSLL